MNTLIVIPTLNEARHIAQVLSAIEPFAVSQDACVVVADGGSTDATCSIVRETAADAPWLHLIDNPGRYQSAAVNLAVETFGDTAEWLIRMDAHSSYPPDFCATLIREAETTDAASVVVTMYAKGNSTFQQIAAAAQNSRFGNGASAHRNRTEGAWVDHGHHALMRLDAFRAIGGYDPSFTHNEDAEFDYRLALAGYRIWLSARTEIEYFPRNSLRGVMRQYFLFGRGRARNLAKHQARPARRQKIVAALAPALALALLSPLNWIFDVPLLAWVAACVVAGLMIARDLRQPRCVFAGPVAGLMQLAWSAGYWVQTFCARLAGAFRLRGEI